MAGTNFNILSKPPPDEDKRGWYRWFYRVCEILNGMVLGTDMTDIFAATLDPTGWVDPSAITVTYNDAADTITLTGTLDYYWRGVKTTLTSPWTSTAHPATTGKVYYLYSTDGVNFTWSETLWAFSDLMIAAVSHGASAVWALREVHGLMPWQSHEDAHRSHGTYSKSPATLAGWTAGSTTAAERRPSVSGVVLYDEDVISTIAALADNGPYTQCYLSGTTTTFATAQSDIVPLSGSRPYYNSYSAPNWGQTLMPASSYMCVWLVAIPTALGTESQKYRFLWVQGQSAGTLAAQQALNPQDINLGQLGTLAAEFVFLAKVIIQYIGTDWNIHSITLLTGNRAVTVGSPSGAYISDAPIDGLIYVRRNGAWEELVIA